MGARDDRDVELVGPESVQIGRGRHEFDDLVESVEHAAGTAAVPDVETGKRPSGREKKNDFGR